MKYIATFHTHVSALLTHRNLKAAGELSRMAPVPRELSSSCGTCVFYEAQTSCLEQMDSDVEAVYQIHGEETYQLIHDRRN